MAEVMKRQVTEGLKVENKPKEETKPQPPNIPVRTVTEGLKGGETSATSGATNEQKLAFLHNQVNTNPDAQKIIDNYGKVTDKDWQNMFNTFINKYNLQSDFQKFLSEQSAEARAKAGTFSSTSAIVDYDQQSRVLELTLALNEPFPQPG